MLEFFHALVVDIPSVFWNQEQGHPPLNLAMQRNANNCAVLAILESFFALKKEIKCTAIQQAVRDYIRLPIHNAILFGALAATILDMVDNHAIAVRTSDESNNNNEEASNSLGIAAWLLGGSNYCFSDCISRALEMREPANVCILHPIVRLALSRPIHVWETKRSSSFAGVMSELRFEAT